MEPLVLPPAEAFRVIGVGNTKGYELIGAGELDVIKIGRATRITVASLKDFVSRHIVHGLSQ